MAPGIRSLIAFALIAFTFVTAQDTPIPLNCNTGVQIIAVPGANVTNGTYGRTATFVKDVLGNISNSASFSVNYNRFSNSTSGFIPGVNQGVPAFRAALVNYTTACPNTPVVVHGYSQGAVIVANVLCGASSSGFSTSSPLNASYASHIISVILYGDESRTKNQAYDYGTCNVSGPYFARRTPQGCAAFAPTFQSYCNDDDFACCASANASAPWATGVNPHWLYPNYYDGNATRFVVSQYQAYKAAHANASSSSSSVVGTTTTTTSTSANSTSTTSTSVKVSSSNSTTTATTTKLTTTSTTTTTKASTTSSKLTTSTTSKVSTTSSTTIKSSTSTLLTNSTTVKTA